MLLRDIGLSVEDESLLPDGRSAKDFNAACYHVNHSFLVHLTTELNGQHFLPNASKVVVWLVDEQHHGNYFSCGGVVGYPVFGADLEAFFGWSELDQEAWMLETLSGALREVAIREGVSAAPIEAALARAESEGLLLGHPLRKLCRVHRGTGLQFDVIRCIRRGDEQWRLSVSNPATGASADAVIEESTFGVLAASRYHSSRWRDDVFQILNKRKRITFRRSVGPFAKRLLD